MCVRFSAITGLFCSNIGLFRNSDFRYSTGACTAEHARVYFVLFRWTFLPSHTDSTAAYTSRHYGDWCTPGDDCDKQVDTRVHPISCSSFVNQGTLTWLHRRESVSSEDHHSEPSVGGATGREVGVPKPEFNVELRPLSRGTTKSRDLTEHQQNVSNDHNNVVSQSADRKLIEVPLNGSSPSASGPTSTSHW